MSVLSLKWYNPGTGLSPHLLFVRTTPNSSSYSTWDNHQQPANSFQCMSIQSVPQEPPGYLQTFPVVLGKILKHPFILFPQILQLQTFSQPQDLQCNLQPTLVTHLGLLSIPDIVSLLSNPKNTDLFHAIHNLLVSVVSAVIEADVLNKENFPLSL